LQLAAATSGYDSIGSAKWLAMGCLAGWRKIMRINEISKDVSCSAVERDLLHLLLKIERRFREEERKNPHSQRGRSHQNLLRIINAP
jgi:hypothetical protein